MRVLVVGGALSVFNRMLKNKYESYGLNIEWHWNWHSNPKPIPQNCEGIVLIQNMVGSHTLANSVVEQAKNKNLPWAMVSSQFAKALPVLRSKGLISPPDEEDLQEVSDTEKLEFIVDYIVNQLKYENREPHHREMEDLVEKSFGVGTSLSWDSYIVGLSKAKQRIHCDITEEPMQQVTEVPLSNGVNNLDMNEYLKISTAYDYYSKTIPEGIYKWSLSRFREAIYKSEIESKKEDSLWFTTRGAIDTFFLKVMEGDIKSPGRPHDRVALEKANPKTTPTPKITTEIPESKVSSDFLQHNLLPHQLYWISGQDTSVSETLQRAVDLAMSNSENSNQDILSKIELLEKQVSDLVKIVQEMSTGNSETPNSLNPENKMEEGTESKSAISLEGILKRGYKVTISVG